MQANEHKDLWIRIRDFAIDDPVASVKYSDKLAYHNGWSQEYTARVILEYKKFIFLCYILPGGASPSQIVDEAWHLHLTYTHSYWKELCGTILRKGIHHFPSRGNEEKDKYAHLYENTLESYRQIFGEDAPADIWPQASKRPEPVLLFEEKPTQYLAWYKKYFFLFLVPFVIIAIAFSQINPYRLTGPQFLVFYGTLVVCSSIYLLLIRHKRKKEVKDIVVKNYKGDADIYQLARFVYGRERSLNAAIVDLVGRKVLEPARKGLFVFHAQNYQYSPLEKNPVTIHLLRNAKNGDAVHYTDLSKYYDDESTYHKGLAGLYRSIHVKDRSPLLICILILLMGVARIIQGAYNNRDILYLAMICVVYCIVALVLVEVFSGNNIFQEIFKGNFKTSPQPNFQSAALASAFVFLGMPYISAMDGHSRMEDIFSRHGRDGKNSSDGCGGSSCGSSDGGGCGGGGCGGCGGGG